MCLPSAALTQRRQAQQYCCFVLTWRSLGLGCGAGAGLLLSCLLCLHLHHVVVDASLLAAGGHSSTATDGTREGLLLLSNHKVVDALLLIRGGDSGTGAAKPVSIHLLLPQKHIGIYARLLLNGRQAAASTSDKGGGGTCRNVELVGAWQ
jgi:hypothetical protein